MAELDGCDHTTVWHYHLEPLAPPKNETERATLSALYGAAPDSDLSTLVSRWLQAITCAGAGGPAPWGVVQSASSTVTGGTTLSVTPPVPIAVGHGVIVVLLSSIGAPSGFAAGTCTDTAGHTYLKAIGQQDGLGIGSSTLYYCPITTGAVATITLTPGAGAADFLVGVIDAGGVGAGLALERSIGGGGISTTPATTTPISPVPQLLGVGALFVRAAEASIAVSTPDGMTPGWVQQTEALGFGASGGFAGEVDSRTLTTANASLQVAWTLPTSGWWAAVLVAFKAT